MVDTSQAREEMIKQFLEDERKKDKSTGVVNSKEENGVSLALPAGDGDTSGAHEEGELDDGVLISWEGPEFETYERDKQWYVTAALVLLLIIAYAVIINSPIMAITFILIGVVGYIYIQKDPRQLTFAITYEGVLVGDELYHFDEIESFWIFYEPPHTYLLSFNLKNRLLPHIHIPLHQVNPVELREVLVSFVEEERQELNLVDTIERLLHI